MILPLPAYIQVQQPVPTPVQAATPQPAQEVRAQFAWSYESSGGNGSGTLSLLMAPISGKLVLEIHSYGERIALLSGDASSGYRIQVPKEHTDKTVPDLARLPLPFLPEAPSIAALMKYLETGEGPGLSVLKRTAGVPVKLRYKGVDEKGGSILVWLTRKRWATAPPGGPPPARP